MNENRTYTEADVAELRKDWQREANERQMTSAIDELRGRLAALPAQMESVARRVVAEVLADQHAQAGRQREEHIERTWARTPAIVQVLQLVVTILALAGSYFAGRGHFP